MAIGEMGKVLRHIQVAFDVGTANGLTDRQLVEQFAARSDSASELAFAALVQRHGPMVLRVCRGILRNHQDTEDAFQATFLVLGRKAGSLWVRDSMGPWLHGVACRVAASSKMAIARRRRHERGAAAITPWCSDNRVDDNEGLKALLHEELGRLPERFRTPIVLCDLEGQTYETVARQLGWPVGTVKSRLARGRERLRDRIVRRGADVSPAMLIGAVSEAKVSLSISSTMIDATAQLAMGLNAGSAAIKLVPATAVRPDGRSAEDDVLVQDKGDRDVSGDWMRPVFRLGALRSALASRADAPPTAQGGVREQGRAEPPSKSASVPRSTPPADEPGVLPSQPKPWETAVRIRVDAKNSAVAGSRTIIHSTPRSIHRSDDGISFAIGPRPVTAADKATNRQRRESRNSEAGNRFVRGAFPVEQNDAGTAR